MNTATEAQPRWELWGRSPSPIFFSQIDKMFFDRMFSKFQVCSFLHVRCGICWNEWDINFSIFAMFSFWDMVAYILKILCTPPFPPSKRAVSIFWSKLLRNVLKLLKKKKLRYLFFGWVINNFVHNFQVFLTEFLGFFRASQKMRNVLKWIFVFMSFFVRFLVFELWSNLYFPLCNVFST